MTHEGQKRSMDIITLTRAGMVGYCAIQFLTICVDIVGRYLHRTHVRYVRLNRGRELARAADREPLRIELVNPPP